MGISAIILAAGLSKRMGKNKLLLAYQGKPIIELLLEKITTLDFDEIILVTSYPEIISMAREKFDVKIIENTASAKGKSQSVKLAVKNTNKGNDFMFFVGDQPLLDRETVGTLIKSFNSNAGTKIIVPVFKTQKGNPVIFPAAYRDELLSLTQDNGGKTIINAYPSRVIFCPIANPAALRDIDQEEDYQNLIKTK